MVRSIRRLFFFGWGFSTTQQPSLCQNSLMFPDGSSFTPLPEAPEGSCSGALTVHGALPSGVTNTLGTRQHGPEKGESSGPLAEQ